MIERLSIPAQEGRSIVIGRPSVRAGAVVKRIALALVVPLAVEYPFWDERTPEALLRFGEPMDAASFADLPVPEVAAALEGRLAAVMDQLALDAQSRDPARFLTLMEGTVGIGGVYDLWRRARAWAGGQAFSAAHNDGQRRMPQREAKRP